MLSPLTLLFSSDIAWDVNSKRDSEVTTIPFTNLGRRTCFKDSTGLDTNQDIVYFFHLVSVDTPNEPATIVSIIYQNSVGADPSNSHPLVM